MHNKSDPVPLFPRSFSSPLQPTSPGVPLWPGAHCGSCCSWATAGTSCVCVSVQPAVRTVRGLFHPSQQHLGQLRAAPAAGPPSWSLCLLVTDCCFKKNSPPALTLLISLRCCRCSRSSSDRKCTVNRLLSHPAFPRRLFDRMPLAVVRRREWYKWGFTRYKWYGKRNIFWGVAEKTKISETPPVLRTILSQKHLGIQSFKHCLSSILNLTFIQAWCFFSLCVIGKLNHIFK